MKTISQYEAELDRIQVSDRWGECRRFQSNQRKIERRNWLINKISTMKTERKGEL